MDNMDNALNNGQTSINSLRENVNFLKFQNISYEEVNELDKNIENIKSEFSKVTNENTSKDKFGYFVKQANEMIKNYEQQILYYKKKSKFYNNKDLSISSNNTINIIPSKKQVFDYEIQSIINETEMTKEPNNSFITLQKIYEKKIENLYAENQNLSKVINKLSTDVVNKLQKEISDYLIELKKEKKKNEELERKVNSIDNIFQQNSLLKSEIEEKNCEISELNTQQIEHMKEIENLNINIKNLNDSIRLMNVNISEKEKILNANSIKIQELTDKIIEKDDIIKKNEDTIQEKENEIQLLYTDNVQWEEKYSIQNSLWEQNLIESYKTIEKLESELKDEKIKNNLLNDEINHIKNVNTEFSSNISILENGIKNIKDKYDRQIINESKNDINNIHILIENSENNLENKKKNYEKNIEEKKDKYEKEIKELNERLNNQEKNSEKLNNGNEEYKNEISKALEIDYTPLVKKKRNRTNNNKKKNKLRYDNIYKQIKVHSIEFITCTINNLLSNKLNKFYKFNKNIVKKDFKLLTQKGLNMILLNIKIKELLTENCEKENNKVVLKVFQKKFKENPEDKNFQLVDQFLNLSFEEMVQIFGMKKEEFFEKYKYENKYLLECKNVKNKNEMKKLIDYGLSSFLEEKSKKSKKLNKK